MIALKLTERVLDSKDWITLLFSLCFIIIGITKNAYSNRFAEYLNLFSSDKYVRVYKDSSNLKSWFTIILFTIQVASFSLFIHYLLYYFLNYSKTDWIIYIRIVTGLTFFILSKFLIEKIIAVLFDIEDFVEQYNLFKISYRTYVALLLLPVLLLFYYNLPPLPVFVYSIITILLLANLLIYINGITIFQKLITAHLFYFILYLCTLEIAPYYFAYYFFTKY